MRLITYNPMRLKHSTIVGNKEFGWSETKETTLKVQIQNGETYFVDQLSYAKDLGFKDTNDIWYSYDPDSHNFHIVPDPSKDKNNHYFDLCTVAFSMIEVAMPERKLLGRSQSKPWLKLHRYKYVNVDPYQYLISFNRLWCDNGKHIHNTLGMMQVMRYRVKCDCGKDLAAKYQINWDKGTNFKMMYPSSGEHGAGRYDPESGSLVYNMPFSILESKNENVVIEKWANNVSGLFSEIINNEDLGGWAKANSEGYFNLPVPCFQ